MLTDLEKKIIKSIQGDIPIAERPFHVMAEQLDISEDQFLDILKDLCKRGIIRRFGATIRHQKSGFKSNAMVAWQVDQDQIDTVGQIMASFKEVSHCYHRRPKEDWMFNLYTMIHAKDKSSCLETARKMAEKAGVDVYKPLFSRKELKKTSMEYFSTDNES